MGKDMQHKVTQGAIEVELFIVDGEYTVQVSMHEEVAYVQQFKDYPSALKEFHAKEKHYIISAECQVVAGRRKAIEGEKLEKAAARKRKAADKRKLRKPAKVCNKTSKK